MKILTLLFSFCSFFYFRIVSSIGASRLSQHIKTNCLLDASPLVSARSLVDDNIVYSSQLLPGANMTGSSKYIELSRDWRQSVAPSLRDYKFCILKISTLSDTTAIVNWNVSFVPESIEAVVSVFSLIPFVKIRYFDLLNRERMRSSFSWEVLGKTLLKLAETGEFALPHAVIVGSSEMTFSRKFVRWGGNAYDNGDGDGDGFSNVNSNSDDRNGNEDEIITLISQKDSLNLIKSLDAGYLKNRKLALDLLEFCDKIRPTSVSFDEWNDIVRDRVDARKVPGMGQFDIDGLEGSNEEITKSLSSALLRLMLSLALVTVLFNDFLWTDLLFSSDIDAANMIPLDM